MARKSKSRETDDLLIVDSNGEIIGTIGPGDKIVRAEQSEYCRQYDTNFGNGESFVKVFDSYHKELNKKLTPGERGFLWSITPYISYKDGILKDNGRILTISMLAEILGVTHEAVRKVVVSLVAKGVLGEHKTGSISNPKVITKCITANPFIFCRGKDINKTIIGLFENSGWNKNSVKNPT